jgi:hypothetical protein
MLSTRTSIYDGVDQHGELSSSPVSQSETFDDMHPHSGTSLPLQHDVFELVLTVEPVSGRYFSFPSFDLYEANQQDEEKEAEGKSP